MFKSIKFHVVSKGVCPNTVARERYFFKITFLQTAEEGKHINKISFWFGLFRLHSWISMPHGLYLALEVCSQNHTCCFFPQGKEGSVSLRVRKAEQYFYQADTHCSINSCPELLRKGKLRPNSQPHITEPLFILQHIQGETPGTSTGLLEATQQLQFSTGKRSIN